MKLFSIAVAFFVIFLLIYSFSLAVEFIDSIQMPTDIKDDVVGLLALIFIVLFLITIVDLVELQYKY